MSEKGIDAPIATTETRKIQDSEHNPVYGIFGKIDRRVDRALANPDLTPEQMQKLFTIANLSKLALSLGNPLAVYFAKELIKFSDPLMVPEETTGEQG